MKDLINWHMRGEFGMPAVRSTYPRTMANLAVFLQKIYGSAKREGSSKATAFDWGGGTGFKIYLVVTSNIPGFAASHIKLELPWTQSHFQWLEDPLVIDGRSQCYRFGGDRSFEFRRELVLNHRLEVTRPFTAGESAKGFLLGFGYDPIPEKFSQGKMIPAFLILYDQFSRPYRVPIELWADRTTKNLRPRRLCTRRKGGLLDKRDPIGRH